MPPGTPGRRTLRVTLDGERSYEVEVREEGGRTIARIGGRDLVVELHPDQPDGVAGLVDGRPLELGAPGGDLSTVFVPGGRPFDVQVEEGPAPRSAPRLVSPAVWPREVTSPITGVVLDLLVRPGARVSPGEPLLIIEAMKMENRVVAPAAALVEHVAVAVGDRVRPGEPLVRLVAPEALP